MSSLFMLMAIPFCLNPPPPIRQVIVVPPHSDYCAEKTSLASNVDSLRDIFNAISEGIIRFNKEHKGRVVPLRAYAKLYPSCSYNEKIAEFYARLAPGQRTDSTLSPRESTYLKRILTESGSKLVIWPQLAFTGGNTGLKVRLNAYHIDGVFHQQSVVLDFPIERRDLDVGWLVALKVASHQLFNKFL